MFEIMVLIYIGLHLAYVVYAKKKAKGTVNSDDFLVLLGLPIVKKLPKKYGAKLINDQETLHLRQLNAPKNLEEASIQYISGKMGLVYLAMAIGGLFSLVFGYQFIPERPIDYVIERPDFGAEPVQFQLNYEVDNQGEVINKTVPVLVEPKLPKGQEALSLLENYYSTMVEVMLASGDNQERVTQDLNFESNPAEVPIVATYKSLTPEYLTDRGELRRNEMALDTAYDISVLVTLSLSDREIQNVYEFTAFRVPMNMEAELGLVNERIATNENEVLLPDLLVERDTPITWHRSSVGVKGVQVFGITIGLSLLIFYFRKESLVKALEERKTSILTDFPDVVAKLTMLINAGMTFKRAWHKIVTDYQERSKVVRPLYEEMLVTTASIQNGMPEKEALEAFGKRTGNKEVMRMTAILIQNLRRGSNSLTESLKQLSMEAWDIRITNAKLLGEKASTKLLLPMGISFVTVIIIVLVPTLMSMTV